MVLAEKAPQMLYTIPGTEDTITIYKDQNLEFEAYCFDLNNDTLSYQWQINSAAIENYNSQFYNFTSNTTGIYELHVTASDSEAQVEKIGLLR